MSKLKVEEALEHLGGSEKLYITLLNGFLDKYIHVDEEIKRLAESGSYHEARILAHSMKGLSGNLGALDLYEKAKNLEHVLKVMDVGYKKELDLFKIELDEVVEEIKMISHQKSNPEQRQADTNEGEITLENAFKELYRALNSYKYADIKKRVSAIDQLQIPEVHRQVYDQVKHHIVEYNFNEARDLIAQIKFTTE